MELSGMAQSGSVQALYLSPQDVAVAARPLLDGSYFKNGFTQHQIDVLTSQIKAFKQLKAGSSLQCPAGQLCTCYIDLLICFEPAKRSSLLAACLQL